MTDIDITLPEAVKMTEDFHDKLLWGLCFDDDKVSLNPEVDQLICIAVDHLSIARHTLKMASIRERATTRKADD